MLGSCIQVAWLWVVPTDFSFLWLSWCFGVIFLLISLIAVNCSVQVFFAVLILCLFYFMLRVCSV